MGVRLSDTRIQLRRGIASQWTAANTVLASGELGLELDTFRIKMGDGSTAWIDLPYAVATGIQILNIDGPLAFNSTTKTLSLDVPKVTDGGAF
jgi:hypothetical protein